MSKQCRSFLFVLSPLIVAMAATTPSRDAEACSVVDPWERPTTLVDALPIDAPIPLTSEFYFEYQGKKVKVLKAVVTDAAGAIVAGKVADWPFLGFVFVPSAQLFPNAKYHVSFDLDWRVRPKMEFDFTTGATALSLPVVPANIQGTVRAEFQSFRYFDNKDGNRVCCDTPHDSCSHLLCFSRNPTPVVRLELSWQRPPANGQFMRYEIVAEDPSRTLATVQGGTYATVDFTEHADRYCVRIKATNVALSTGPTVTSEPVCIDNGSIGPLSEFKFDFGPYLRECETAPKGWANGWKEAQVGGKVGGPDAKSSANGGGADGSSVGGASGGDSVSDGGSRGGSGGCSASSSDDVAAGAIALGAAAMGAVTAMGRRRRRTP